MKQQFNFFGLAAFCLLVFSCGTNDGESESQYDIASLGGNAKNTVEDLLPLPGAGNRFDQFTDNPFVSTAEQPVSTFSVDADGASYAIIRRYLSSGYRVNAESVRIEEMLNYFTFNYPSPTDGNNVAIDAEVGECPWNADHQLLRLGLKGKSLAEGEKPKANYVFLVDVSGSMYGQDRLPLLKSGLTALLNQMRPDDRVSIITYSGTVERLLESTLVREKSAIIAAIERLNASGSTAGGEALKMAYQEAMANYDPARNNRVIMGTDGDFNVGVTSTEELVEMVQTYAEKGIYMTCLGFGMGNFNDSMMEKISNAGNGTYNYIDSEDEMMRVLVHESDQFVSVANDTKCQVTFDSLVVSRYRLIGYENRILNNSDFKNDSVDAGEIGAGQTITALYELELKDQKAEGNSGKTFVTFDCRYKKSLGSESIPLTKKLTVADIFTKQGRSDNFYFAAGVATFGMMLRNSPYKGNASYEMAFELVDGHRAFDPYGYREALVGLIRKATENNKQY